MKNRIFKCGVVAVLGFMCCSCSMKQGIQPMRRGVNLSHWFSQTRLPEYPPNAAVAEDMKLIRSLGLDHVRLPVDPVRLWTFSGNGPLDPKALRQVDDAIQLALDHDLNVVVDMHPKTELKERLENDSATFQSFLKMWKELAAHLAQYDADRLALEILNEPMVKDSEKWQAMVNELHSHSCKVAIY